MQFNIKWNSYNDSLIAIWSFEIIVQINHNTNAVNSWHWHECSDTFNFEWANHNKTLSVGGLYVNEQQVSL